MAIRPIIELGNPLLRQASCPVRQEELEEIHKLALDMYDTLLDFRQRMAYGRGIAAPQVGVHKRLVVLQHQGMPLVLINPKFTEKSEEMFTVWDACFSYPGIWFQVRRHRRVKVSYRDLNWQVQTLEAEGDLAELLQHELEHLDGHLAIDLADSKSFCTTNEFFSRYWEDGETE
ncbi:MAG: peptide deformylase [Bacillota bacterium]|jgi:peptide deformylase